LGVWFLLCHCPPLSSTSVSGIFFNPYLFHGKVRLSRGQDSCRNPLSIAAGIPSAAIKFSRSGNLLYWYGDPEAILEREKHSQEKRKAYMYGSRTETRNEVIPLALIKAEKSGDLFIQNTHKFFLSE
jgi:hypothetical protein